MGHVLMIGELVHEKKGKLIMKDQDGIEPMDKTEEKIATIKTIQKENTVQKTAVYDEAAAQTERRRTIAVRVIWYVTGIILVLLAFRFVLALLGANLDNAFANGIFQTSDPFVSPFFGLFGYTVTYGVASLQPIILVAMAVYALVAWGIVKLVTITR